MSKDELIDMTCWLMNNLNSDNAYITVTNDRTFINGGYQTDLRYYLNLVKDMEFYDAVDFLKGRLDVGVVVDMEREVYKAKCKHYLAEGETCCRKSGWNKQHTCHITMRCDGECRRMKNYDRKHMM